jgi:hypothetical protein
VTIRVARDALSSKRTDRGDMIHSTRADVATGPTTARPEPQGEVPLWKLVAGLVVVVTVLAATLICVCFLAAWLVTGHAVG